MKLVSMFYGRAPFGVFSKAKADIRTPKDLASKNLGAQVGDSIRTVFPAYAEQAAKPKTVRSFLAGAIKGYEDAINHPNEAVNMILKLKPLLDPNIAHGEMPLIKRLVLTEDAQKHCIGGIANDKIAETGRVMLAAHNVKESVDIKTTDTNAYLPCK